MKLWRLSSEDRIGTLALEIYAYVWILKVISPVELYPPLITIPDRSERGVQAKP